MYFMHLSNNIINWFREVVFPGGLQSKYNYSYGLSNCKNSIFNSILKIDITTAFAKLAIPHER